MRLSESCIGGAGIASVLSRTRNVPLRLHRPTRRKPYSNGACNRSATRHRAPLTKNEEACVHSLVPQRPLIRPARSRSYWRSNDEVSLSQSKSGRRFRERQPNEGEDGRLLANDRTAR